MKEKGMVEGVRRTKVEEDKLTGTVHIARMYALIQNFHYCL
jgi:hypothetical protein